MKIILNQKNENPDLSEEKANDLLAEFLIQWIRERKEKDQSELYIQLTSCLEELIKIQEVD